MPDQTTIPEAFTDLLDAPFATLATVGADGPTPTTPPPAASGPSTAVRTSARWTGTTSVASPS